MKRFLLLAGIAGFAASGQIAQGYNDDIYVDIDAGQIRTNLNGVSNPARVFDGVFDETIPSNAGPVDAVDAPIIYAPSGFPSGQNGVLTLVYEPLAWNGSAPVSTASVGPMSYDGANIVWGPSGANNEDIFVQYFTSSDTTGGSLTIEIGAN